MKKTYTFKIDYTDAVGNNKTFSGEYETQLAAINGYEWFIYENETNRNGCKINDISVVFNEAAAKEYGANYGTPEQYYAKKNRFKATKR